MSREEKLNKILEMSGEIIKLLDKKIPDDEIDNMYIQTKFMLESYKELNKEE